MRSTAPGTTKVGATPGTATHAANQCPNNVPCLRRQPGAIVLDDNLDKARRAVVSKAQYDFRPGVLARRPRRSARDQRRRAHPGGETSGNVVVVLGQQYANDVHP